MATFNTFGGTTYYLASSISSTATSIPLSSFADPTTGVPYTMVLLNTDIVYATIAPKTSQSEFISFTGITQNSDGSALLTGVTRGLAKYYPFTESTDYKLPHAGQSQFIISDAPQVFEKYPAKDADETITGQWTFDTFPITPSNSDASTTVKGVSKLSVAPASATDPIAVGTNDNRVPVAYAVDSVGTDAYAITPSPVITAYVAGQTFTFKAGTANTGAATLNVNGLGAVSIKKNVSEDLETGDILANQVVVLKYDGTNMQMIYRFFATKIDTFLSSGTYTKPDGAKAIQVKLWGGGASGAKGNTTGGGGGGGAYNQMVYDASTISSPVTVTIGDGGVAKSTSGDGNAGGTSSFGSYLLAYGGGGGAAASQSGGGGGGGQLGVGGTGAGSRVAGTAGSPGSPINGTGNGSTGLYSGGGGADNGAGGNSVYGGGGGGGSSGGAGGTSQAGGNGGAGHATDGVAGSVPGGGGGAIPNTGNSSGAGGKGKCVVITYF